MVMLIGLNEFVNASIDANFNYLNLNIDAGIKCMDDIF